MLPSLVILWDAIVESKDAFAFTIPPLILLLPIIYEMSSVVFIFFFKI